MISDFGGATGSIASGTLKARRCKEPNRSGPKAKGAQGTTGSKGPKKSRLSQVGSGIRMAHLYDIGLKRKSKRTRKRKIEGKMQRLQTLRSMNY